MKKSRFLLVFRWFHVRCGIKWYRVPTIPLKLAYLALHRRLLRAENLHDTSVLESASALPVQPRPSWRYLYARSPDGAYNDLEAPAMGRVETRFGRNLPVASSIAEDQPGAALPSPHAVSERLLRRGDDFKPAEPINLLAAAWIQFMAHDWMDHGRSKDPVDKFKVAVEDGRFVDIQCTLRDQTHGSVAALSCPTFLNRATHWWDGSQIYGSRDDNRSGGKSNEAAQRRLRAWKHGKLRLENDLLPVTPEGKERERGDTRPFTEDTGVRANWWLGLGLMHTLFVLEHNAICDALHEAFPHWDDDDLYDHARLVNTALMARIHTLEWTPALLDHPAIVRGMQGNWWGLATEYLHRWTGRPRADIWLALRELLPGIARSELLGGVRGSPVDHHGVPYAITEEFVSIYRMHPLLPDTLALYSLAGGRPEARTDLEPGIMHYAFKHTGSILAETGLAMPELFYSFGVAHPGALVLRNVPEALRNLELSAAPGLKQSLKAVQDETGRIDVGLVDILRDRERGVPRYNDFRTLVHMPRLRSFEALLPGDRQRDLRLELERLYGEVDNLDLMVGLLAEPKPPGFAFSDTAFLVFVLMASRRLKSDRFFASDYRPEVYTQLGLDWVDRNTMKTVLLRHYQGLAPHLESVANAFRPWTTSAPGHRAARATRARAAAPALRLRIPLLLDVVLVKDHELAARLNNHPCIDRLPTGAGALVNRLVQRRIAGELQVNGRALPAFAGRDDEVRRAQQAAMSARLSELDLAIADAEITQMADYVGGRIELDETGVGVVAQRLIARMLGVDYRATRAGFDAARTMNHWHRLGSLPRARRRARRRLWAAAGEDGYVIHGTSFAVHNLVEVVAEMRRLAGLCGDDPPPAAQVVARCLVAPQRVLRICQADIEVESLDRPLKRGTLLILLLRRMHGGTRLNERAFSRGAWSQCPAHGLVPRLLAEIWNRAVPPPR